MWVCKRPEGGILALLLLLLLVAAGVESLEQEEGGSNNITLGRYMHASPKCFLSSHTGYIFGQQPFWELCLPSSGGNRGGVRHYLMSIHVHPLDRHSGSIFWALFTCTMQSAFMPHWSHFWDRIFGPVSSVGKRAESVVEQGSKGGSNPAAAPTSLRASDPILDVRPLILFYTFPGHYPSLIELGISLNWD